MSTRSFMQMLTPLARYIQISLRRMACGLLFAALMMSIGAGMTDAQELKSCKILVVMSYEEDFPGDKDAKQGIDETLPDTCEVQYFYMNTKKNFAGGEAKAKEAYELFQTFQPDGVITVDDNAQSMFVLPYLKDKVTIPIMFCGVNADPAKYSYPASHISGILEREQIKESLILAQQLLPEIKTFAYIQKADPSADAVIAQIQAEVAAYPLQLVATKQVKSEEDALAAIEELKPTCDILLTATMQGLLDKQGQAMPEQAAIQLVTKTFGKPVIGLNSHNPQYGLLCVVAKTMQEQGGTAAKMLMQALQGTPVSELAVTQNQYGKKIVNADVIRAFGIKPAASILRGVEIIKTTP